MFCAYILTAHFPGKVPKTDVDIALTLTANASRPLSVERTKFGNNIPSIRAFRIFALAHVVVRN